MAEKADEEPNEGTPLMTKKKSTMPGALGILADATPDTSTGFLKSLLPPLIVYGIGVGGLCYLEGWPFLLSNYVVAQIVTTIGYGDFTVTQTGAKVFMGIYGMTVIVVLAYYHSLLIGNLIQWECDALRQYLRKIEIDSDEAVQTDAQAEKRYALMNQALASASLFLPALLFGTIYYRLEEHCSCSYGISRVEGCDATDYFSCVETNGFVKDWASAFYMSAITLTTIGFGDYQPRSVLGRILGIAWMIVGTICTATFLGSLSSWFFTDTKTEGFDAKDALSGIDEETFNQIDTNHNGSLSRGEFMAYTLLKYELVSKDLLDEINKVYDTIDSKNTNAVTLDMILNRDSMKRRETTMRKTLSCPPVV